MKKLSQSLKAFFDIPIVMFIWTVVVSMGLAASIRDGSYWWAAFTGLALLIEGIDFCITNKGRAV